MTNVTLILCATKLKIDFQKLSLGTANRFVKSSSPDVTNSSTNKSFWIGYVKTNYILNLITDLCSLFSVLLI